MSRPGELPPNPLAKNGDPDSDDFPPWLDALAPHVVVATHWLDPGSKGKPFRARVKFSGRRVGVEGKLQPKDRFEQVETIDGVLPGSGPIAISTHAVGVNPGQ